MGGDFYNLADSTTAEIFLANGQGPPPSNCGTVVKIDQESLWTPSSSLFFSLSLCLDHTPTVVRFGHAAIIAATSHGHLTLLTTERGKSYGANAFSEMFRKWCDAGGLPQHCVFHGLRKAACTRLADAGASVHEIAAISGHQTLKEIARYTKAADQARLALGRIANTGVKSKGIEVSNPLNGHTKKAAG